MPTKNRLSLQDSMFLMAESRETPVHVGGLQIFRLPPRAPAHFVAKLFAKLRAYPVTAPPLNYRLTGGIAGKVLPSWEALDHVDLNYHFRLSALPNPGGERELGALVSRLHTNPMDLTRPLWEYHLIEGLEGRRFATYTKLHHAMVDGAAAMRLVKLSTDRSDRCMAPFWFDESQHTQESAASSATLLEQLPALIGDEMRSLSSLARGLASTAQAALGVSTEPDLASIAEAPRTLLNVRIGAQRRVATYATALKRLQAIGHAAGGTINDVVLAMCSGALRRYLDERDALPSHTLIAAVPMALHPKGEAEAGNAVSCLIVRLGTDTEDVRQRFATICRSAAAGKAQVKGMTPTAAMHFATVLSLPMVLQPAVPGLDQLLGPQANLIISNLPGSRDRLYLHGAEMLAHYPVSQVGHGMALNITVVSYAGGLYFGLVACPDAVPSVQRLALHLATALDELEATFLSSAQPAARAKSAAARPRVPAKRATRTRSAGGAEKTATSNR